MSVDYTTLLCSRLSDAELVHSLLSLPETPGFVSTTIFCYMRRSPGSQLTSCFQFE